MAENASLPVLRVVDEDPSAVDTLVSDLERRFAADYRVVGSPRHRRRWTGWPRCVVRANSSP